MCCRALPPAKAGISETEDGCKPGLVGHPRRLDECSLALSLKCTPGVERRITRWGSTRRSSTPCSAGWTWRPTACAPDAGLAGERRADEPADHEGDGRCGIADEQLTRG